MPFMASRENPAGHDRFLELSRELVAARDEQEKLLDEAPSPERDERLRVLETKVNEMRAALLEIIGDAGPSPDATRA